MSRYEARVSGRFEKEIGDDFGKAFFAVEFNVKVGAEDRYNKPKNIDVDEINYDSICVIVFGDYIPVNEKDLSPEIIAVLDVEADKESCKIAADMYSGDWEEND